MERTLRFEPGMHVITKDQGAEIYNQFINGEIASMWNPEIRKRMRQYQPQVIGIDSLTPGFDYVSDNPDYSYSVNGQFDWAVLPGSPVQMTGRDSVYAVAGDPLNVMDFTKITSEEYNKQWDNYFKTLEESDFKVEVEPPKDPDEIVVPFGDIPLLVEKEPRDYIKQALLEGLGTTLLGFAFLVNSMRNRLPVSRRWFLRAAGMGLLGLTIGRTAPFLGSYSTSSEIQPLIQGITDMTKPIFAKSNWLDARTALVIAKTQEAMDRLYRPQDEIGSVVMGWPHAYAAGALLRSVEERKKLIYSYGREMLELLYPVLEKPGFEGATAKDVQGIILPYLCATDIYLVREPDFEGKRFREALGESYDVVDSFMCQEAIEALKPLDTTGVLQFLQ